MSYSVLETDSFDEIDVLYFEQRRNCVFTRATTSNGLNGLVI